MNASSIIITTTLTPSQLQRVIALYNKTMKGKNTFLVIFLVSVILAIILINIYFSVSRSDIQSLQEALTKTIYYLITAVIVVGLLLIILRFIMRAEFSSYRYPTVTWTFTADNIQATGDVLTTEMKWSYVNTFSEEKDMFVLYSNVHGRHVIVLPKEDFSNEQDIKTMRLLLEEKFGE